MKENIISITQRIFKTDLKYLFHGGFWLAFGHILQIFSGLLLTISFANFLDKNSYGIYQYVMAAAAIISSLTLSGVAVAVKRSVAQGNEGALRYGFRIKLLWSFSIVAISGAFALYYFFKDNNLLGTAFLIVGCFAPFIESFSLYKSYLVGSKKFKESALLGFWRKPIMIVAVISTLLITKDPLTILFVYFLSNTISVGLLYHLVVTKYKLPQQKADIDILKYSKHLSVLGIFGVISNNIDKIIIFTTLGAVEVAVYSFAVLPITHSLKFFGFVSNDLIFPKFVKHSFNTIGDSILKKITIFFLVTTLIVVAYYFTAHFLFNLLFPSYPEAIALSQIAMLALLTKPASLFGTVFIAHAYKKIQYFLTSSTAVVKILSLVALIPIYGVTGGIISILITHVYWAIAVTLLFYYIYKKQKGDS